MAQAIGFAPPSCNSAGRPVFAKCIFTRRRWAISALEKESGAGSNTIVIVGAGIAGLATALAFHRLGIKTLVLEQSDSLRAGGTAIGVWKNAWRALDVLGVADELRESFGSISSAKIFSDAGNMIHEFSIHDDSELRPVQRKALLEALAKPLPQDTIRFNSKVEKIAKVKQGEYTEIYLDDGTTITSKVLIGCDGVRSVVAKWMGLKEPNFVGQYGTRGVANYPKGHRFGSVLRQYLGRGVRAGVIPMDSNKVYWFLAFKSSSQGVITDHELMKEETKNMIKDWSKDAKEVMFDLIDNSTQESFSRNSLRDRWAIPYVTPSLAVDGVTLAGDALHPLTPNLGQGGCLALEDGVILAREIYASFKNQGESSNGISQALEAYVNQRWKRFLPLTVKSRIIGTLLMLESPLICYVRDNFGLRLALRPSSFLSHTYFDCGALPTP